MNVKDVQSCNIIAVLRTSLLQSQTTTVSGIFDLTCCMYVTTYLPDNEPNAVIIMYIWSSIKIHRRDTVLQDKSSSRTKIVPSSWIVSSTFLPYSALHQKCHSKCQRCHPLFWSEPSRGSATNSALCLSQRPFRQGEDLDPRHSLGRQTNIKGTAR